MIPAHCSDDIAPVPESVRRSIRIASAGMRNRFQSARSSASRRSAGVLIRSGSTLLMRNGSMMVFRVSSPPPVTSVSASGDGPFYGTLGGFAVVLWYHRGPWSDARGWDLGPRFSRSPDGAEALEPHEAPPPRA